MAAVLAGFGATGRHREGGRQPGRRLADAGARRLIIDITSLPRYWFFPMLPKTISLAMCLYSIAVAARGQPRVPVYAQPMRYPLDYSTRMGRHGDAPDVTGY